MFSSVEYKVSLGKCPDFDHDLSNLDLETNIIGYIPSELRCTLLVEITVIKIELGQLPSRPVFNAVNCAI